jgi:hypothetical protein
MADTASNVCGRHGLECQVLYEGPDCPLCRRQLPGGFTAPQVAAIALCATKVGIAAVTLCLATPPPGARIMLAVPQGLPDAPGLSELAAKASQRIEQALKDLAVELAGGNRIIPVSGSLPSR